MKTTWTSTFAWLLAALAALALAWAAPNEASVMGQLPAFMGRTLDRQAEVLARAEGMFDAGKARNLRETLQQRGY